MIRLTRQQMREIDCRSIEEYRIPGVVLMENAARAVADAACEMLGNDCTGQVLILCGGGNNGGDGLAAARHLVNRGTDVSIGLATDPNKYRNEALVNWEIVRAMQIKTWPIEPEKLDGSRALLIVDAIFGTGLTDTPREPFARLVEAVHRTRLPVLAVDIPSGLDCDTGRALGNAVHATRTVTFVAEKAGFANPESRAYLGEVTIGDIGCPREVVEAVLREGAGVAG